MVLPLYQIDAFTSQLFKGNPAAVIPLTEWIDAELMQNIAMENNLSDTAFFVPNSNGFEIRWFTPEMEINLCGHASLATAYYLYQIAGYNKEDILFESPAGPLQVSRKQDMYLLNFPRWKPERYNENTDDILEAVALKNIAGVYKYRDLIIEAETEKDIIQCTPDFTALKKTGKKVIITAPGSSADFVSRFFAPVAGIDEDPVTGSAHSQIIPFWSEKLGKNRMQAKQLSKRGGDLYCEDLGNRVIIGGQCAFFMKGEITI